MYSTTCTVSSALVSPFNITNQNLFLDFPAAQQQFEKILKIDPCRIDDIDVYSNILYVTENRLTLSKLAHDFLALDKDRPEVCCLVGTKISPLLLDWTLE
jgi:hypothetical protein